MCVRAFVVTRTRASHMQTHSACDRPSRIRLTEVREWWWVSGYRHALACRNTKQRQKRLDREGTCHMQNSPNSRIYSRETGTTHAQADEILPFSSAIASLLAQNRRRAVVGTEVAVRLVLAQTCTNIGSFISSAYKINQDVISRHAAWQSPRFRGVP